MPSDKKKRKKKRQEAAAAAALLALELEATGEEGAGEEALAYADKKETGEVEEEEEDEEVDELICKLSLLNVNEESVNITSTVKGLKVIRPPASTKRSRVERNRAIVNHETLRKCGIKSGDHVQFTAAKNDGTEMGSVLCSLWGSSSLKMDEIQPSRSVEQLFGKNSFQNVNIVCFNTQNQIATCSLVQVHLEGQDVWSRNAIAASYQSSHVPEYIKETIFQNKLISKGTKFGILLNGYYCYLVVDQLDFDPEHQDNIGIGKAIRNETQIDIALSLEQQEKQGQDENTIDENTVSNENKKTDKVIGGLKKQIKQVEAILELALNPSENGISFRLTRGILLHGPPGTGKTLIAKTIANSFNAKVLVINGAEVVSKYVGLAESRLRQTFEQAKKIQPCVIFIDEVDALCPSREESENDQMHTRIVALMLKLLDDIHLLSEKEPVSIAVLAATNRPDTLDLALRRPGRFDREILVSAPNESDRVEILKVHLQKMPNQLSDEQVQLLGQDLHGFVGADILSLCREAGWCALRNHVKDKKIKNGQDEQDTQNDAVFVSFDDFIQARGTIRPSALRELAIQVPHVKWEDVGGQTHVKQQLKEAVEWPLQHPEAFARMGIRPPQGVLLYGPPGCSKTLLAKAIASQGKMNFIAVKGPELFNKWVGESEKAVHQVFEKARESAPTVIFFDEIDALASSRGSDTGSGGVADRVLSQLLLEMDGIEQRARVVVVAATNRPDILDDALVRPGRLDRMIYVPPPDSEARMEILKIHTRKVPLGKTVDLQKLATITTNGYSGAEIASLCQEAAMNALENDMKALVVEQVDFEAAFLRISCQISKEMLDFYEAFDASKRS